LTKLIELQHGQSCDDESEFREYASQVRYPNPIHSSKVRKITDPVIQTEIPYLEYEVEEAIPNQIPAVETLTLTQTPLLITFPKFFEFKPIPSVSTFSKELCECEYCQRHFDIDRD